MKTVRREKREHWLLSFSWMTRGEAEFTTRGNNEAGTTYGVFFFFWLMWKNSNGIYAHSRRHILQPRRYFICFAFQKFLLYLSILNLPCILFSIFIVLADYLVETLVSDRTFKIFGFIISFKNWNINFFVITSFIGIFSCISKAVAHTCWSVHTLLFPA